MNLQKADIISCGYVLWCENVQHFVHDFINDIINVGSILADLQRCQLRKRKCLTNQTEQLVSCGLFTLREDEEKIDVFKIIDDLFSVGVLFTLTIGGPI